MSAFLIALGLLYVEPILHSGLPRLTFGSRPQYWEIWKRKEVVGEFESQPTSAPVLNPNFAGISMLFMTTDMLGGIFSVLSLVFQAQFDSVAAVSYILVVVSLPEPVLLNLV
jgi:hypothetical protein